MQERTKLYRASRFLRTLSVIANDKEYELKNIIVYDENGIILEVGYGYFDTDNETEINGKVVKKLKENFNGKENYVLKFQDNSWYNGDKLYALYVHKDNIDFKFIERKQKFYGDIFDLYTFNGIEIWKYVKDLKTELNSLNTQAEIETKKLKEMFGYNKKGADEEEIKQIFNKLLELNKKIKTEDERIKNYKID